MRYEILCIKVFHHTHFAFQKVISYIIFQKNISYFIYHISKNYAIYLRTFSVSFRKPTR